MANTRHFVTLGMFIIDEFEFMNEDGGKSGKELEPQIGGGGTYAAIGARIWLQPKQIGMIVDRGNDFPSDIQNTLEQYGKDMWLFRDDRERCTTRALNIYHGEHRGFRYLTLRQRLTPRDLTGTPLDRPKTLHFICSPTRAQSIVAEIHQVEGWEPITIYEPIPDRCVPEELDALRQVLPHIDILSPNSDEALSILSMPSPPNKQYIEEAAACFLDMGLGQDGKGHIVIRSGELGAYVASRERRGQWVNAFWTPTDVNKIVDVTGAGNSFLGGLSAGLCLTNGDVFDAVYYASVSASFVIQQLGLPRLTISSKGKEEWKGDDPYKRLAELRERSS